MNHINLLYTNGCSYTKFPEDSCKSNLPLCKYSEQWPALVADKLNADIINDGLWCGSNQRIFRTTLEFLETTKVDPANIFMIIEFTYPYRLEYRAVKAAEDYMWPKGYKDDWIRVNPNRVNPDHPPGHPKWDPNVVCTGPYDRQDFITKPGKHMAYGKMLAYDDYDAYLEFYRYVLAVDNLIKSRNIRHLYFMGKQWMITDEYFEQIKRQVSGFADVPMMNMLDVNEHMKIDRTHADKDGHPVLAEKVYELIKCRV